MEVVQPADAAEWLRRAEPLLLADEARYNLILGLDYRYTDWGNFDYVARSAYLGLTAGHEPSSHAARASLAYKF